MAYSCFFFEKKMQLLNAIDFHGTSVPESLFIYRPQLLLVVTESNWYCRSRKRLATFYWDFM